MIQYEDKQNKNTTQYLLDTTIRKHTQITHLRYEPSYKQLEVKTNPLFYIYAYEIILITYKFCKFGKFIACSDSIPVNWLFSRNLQVYEVHSDAL